jgi:hypothetical protein
MTRVRRGNTLLLKFVEVVGCQRLAKDGRDWSEVLGIGL